VFQRRQASIIDQSEIIQIKLRLRIDFCSLKKIFCMQHSLIKINVGLHQKSPILLFFAQWKINSETDSMFI
jgi:hypothetical protein